MWTRKGTQKKQKYRQRKYRQEKFIGKKVLTNIYANVYRKVYIDKSSSFINKCAIQLPISMPLYLNNFCLFNYLILILKGSIWCFH